MEARQAARSRGCGTTKADYCFRLLQLVFLLDALPPEKRNAPTLMGAMKISKPSFFRTMTDLQKVLQMEVPYVELKGKNRLQDLETGKPSVRGYYYIKSGGVFNVAAVQSLFTAKGETLRQRETVSDTMAFVNRARELYGMSPLG